VEHRQLHLVTDPRLERGALLGAVRAAAENGVDWVQVRDHRATVVELFALAVEVVAICRPLGARVAVNDRVDVALAVGADGVQLGARSLPVAVVRRIAPGLKIGASVHDWARAAHAEAAGADWLTFGHVFPTGSHPGEPPRGLAGLAEVARFARIPVIAIGGIGPEQVRGVLEAGAAGVAAIAAILDAAQPGQAAAELRQRLDGFGRQDG
jgi:thiamine-phosphate pyrophosphorylase